MTVFLLLFMVAVAGAVVCCGEGLIRLCRRQRRPGGALLLVGLALAAAVVPVWHALWDAGIRENNERLLSVAARNIGHCATKLSAAEAVLAWGERTGAVSPAEEVPLLAEQADGATCVLVFATLLADRLQCRTDDVNWLPSADVLREQKVRWGEASYHYDDEIRKGNLLPANISRNIPALSDEHTWPLLSRHRSDEWGYQTPWIGWPDDGGPVELRHPTEDEFHRYCQKLAASTATQSAAR